MRPATSRHRRGPRRRGYSQLEVVAATLLVGIVMTASLETYGASLRMNARTMQLDAGMRSARELMSEILGRRFEETTGAVTLGPDSGESQESVETLDDVDDFDGWSETIEADRFGDRDRTSADGLTWSRTVEVRHVRVDSPGVVVSSRTGLKRVVVMVRRGGNPVAQLVAFAGGMLDEDLRRAAIGRGREDDDTNRSPMARAEANPRIGVGVASVTLDGTASFDPDGDLLTFRWRSEGSTIATTAVATVAVNNASTVVKVQEFELEVSDVHGNRTRDVVRVVIEPPGTVEMTGGGPTP
ncbi:MAG TPA: hypothetical protein PLI18_06700 [Pirellulaceae bacterium]|nr:hypothetical protein [Pirellulaceae bacterium]